MTYLEYHVDKLGMGNTTAYQCLLVKKTKKEISVSVALQVDDSLSVDTASFLSEEQNASTPFRSKSRAILRDSALDLNAVRLKRDVSERMTIHQYDKIVGLSLLNNYKEFAGRGGAIQYIGMN